MLPRPLLLGHRGARKYAPENTVAAFQAALDHGCDGFEFDVRLSFDACPVICHDPKYHRHIVSRATYEKLSQRWGELAVLERVLELFHNRAFLNIELKVPGAENLVIAALKRFPPREGLVVSSFLPSVIERFHAQDARADLGLICENRRQFGRWRDLPVTAVMLHRALVSADLVQELKSAGKQVFVWTVNSSREMNKFAAFEVDGIISDDTRMLVKTLRPNSVG